MGCGDPRAAVPHYQGMYTRQHHTEGMTVTGDGAVENGLEGRLVCHTVCWIHRRNWPVRYTADGSSRRSPATGGAPATAVGPAPGRAR